MVPWICETVVDGEDFWVAGRTEPGLRTGLVDTVVFGRNEPAASTSPGFAEALRRGASPRRERRDNRYPTGRHRGDGAVLGGGRGRPARGRAAARRAAPTRSRLAAPAALSPLRVDSGRGQRPAPSTASPTTTSGGSRPRGALRRSCWSSSPLIRACGSPAGSAAAARGGGDRHGGRGRLRARPRRFRDPQLRRRAGDAAGDEERVLEHGRHLGMGQSAIGRQVDRSGFQLTLDAIPAAVDDAGLDRRRHRRPGHVPRGGKANLPGYANGDLYEVQDALGSSPPGGRARSRG